MKKGNLFAMKERDLKFNKTVKISLYIYLRHTLIILSENIEWF